MIGDATVLPFQRLKVTKKPKSELYPICKVEEYEFGKVVKFYWSIKTPDGEEIFFPSYKAAEKYQLDNKVKV